MFSFHLKENVIWVYTVSSFDSVVFQVLVNKHVVLAVLFERMALNLGSTCQNAVLPALMRPPFPPMQPTLDLKPFLPFPLDTAVSLFPNFSASLVGISSRTDQFQPFGSWNAGISASQLCVSMDPVQKAVINHTFGVPLPPKRKHIIPCNICQLRFNSESQASAHYKGTKHAKKLKAQETPKKKQKAAATKDSAKTTFTIITTNTINTSTDKTGTKHKTMLEARSGDGNIKAFPRPAIKGKVAPTTKAVTGLQNKTFHCEVCNVHVNSETQLKQHISSRRHKDRAAGKPPKPKYSPYNKAQRGTTAHAVKLALRKELGKTLTPRILPNHIAAMTAAAVGSPFSLRSTPAGALFQTQALPPALLRPAPGPIRTPHTPVLFAPY
ncbi:zinc finger protein 385D-like isoform X6 [Acipenser ruthenus]|uniref:zinc finger protein 385D-like isoform X6 n=1 Tax=Acipenser ruthenus TaxID=7906 RepID=UPI002740DE1C|nr:zinc finger protein 385D-like isoform X6 [Acipenser ruthenus]